MTEMNSVEELRQKLHERCGRNIACRRAADYYIMLFQNPCYPPNENMTYKMRKFYMEIVKQYGPPPRCDVRKLVEERLRGTVLEKYAPEAAELAELLKKARHVTSRVAAAAVVITIAEQRGIPVTRYSVAEYFGTSYAAVKAYLKDTYKLYAEYIAKRGQ